MGTLIDLPNINPESLVFDNEETSKNDKKSNFDEKNYLNVRLAEGEKEKKLTIRLLPMDLKTGSPFALIHIHNVKVPQDMVEPGKKPYKSYICLRKTKDINTEQFGTKCPFCELNYQAYQDSLKETDPIKKKELQDISIANKEREAVIVRCIERGKEEEGVKFWKFNIRNDKTDPYNTIMNLVKFRRESAEKKGKTENILDIYEGRDLIVTITAEGTSAPTIVDDGDRTPLSENVEQMKEWIFDKKRWQDVFTCKPYEYLKLVSEMRIPWFDKANGVWVDKEEYENNRKDKVKAADAEINEANNTLQGNVSKTDSNPDFVASISVSDDELPY